MIARLPGWSWHLQRDGIVLVGPDTQALRYTERVRPVRRVRDIVRELGRRAAARVEPGPIRAVVTDEGEYAARVDLAGELDGAPYHRAIGVVFADDFYALVDGETWGDPAPLHAVIDQLVATDAHLLGVRRRRFVYEPPRDWHGYLAGPYHATWIPLDHPRDPSQLVVPPAIPRGDDLGVTGVATALLGAEALAGASSTQVTARELSGWWFACEAADVVVLEDRRYLYPLVMRSSAATRAAAATRLSAVLATVEPIPSAAADRASLPAAALSHWIE